MLIGGQAVLVYGEPRLTKDIDITLGAGPEALPMVLSLIKELGLRVLPKDPEKFVKRTMVLPALNQENGWRVDIIFSQSDYETRALKRARKIKLKNIPVYFASPEDVIIHKIIAGRPRDLEDAQAILRKQKKLDFKYIRFWLSQFDQRLDTEYQKSFNHLLK